jgi:hypothetical protein
MISSGKILAFFAIAEIFLVLVPASFLALGIEAPYFYPGLNFAAVTIAA